MCCGSDTLLVANSHRNRRSVGTFCGELKTVDLNVDWAGDETFVMQRTAMASIFCELNHPGLRKSQQGNYRVKTPSRSSKFAYNTIPALASERAL